METKHVKETKRRKKVKRLLQKLSTSSHYVLGFTLEPLSCQQADPRANRADRDFMNEKLAFLRREGVVVG